MHSVPITAAAFELAALVGKGILQAASELIPRQPTYTDLGGNSADTAADCTWGSDDTAAAEGYAAAGDTGICG